MSLSKDKKYLFIFIVVAILWRLASFFPSVLDHDESTYLIMGRDILQGKALYVDVIDSKPAGIFLIFTFLQFVFGYSIFLKRLFVAILVGLTAYFLKKASFKLFKNDRVAIATGFIYIFYTSLWSRIGLSPNTEVLFNFFTASSLLLFFNKTTLNYWFAGLLLGLGFIIQYMVLLDFVALSSFMLYQELKRNNWEITLKDFIPYFLSGIGFMLPFGLLNLYFYLGDHFEAFRFITYEFPMRYTSDGEFMNFLSLMLDYIARFLPVSFLLFYVLFSKKTLLKGWQKHFLIYWMIAVLIAVYLPGKGFGHYAVQLMIPSSIIVGLAFHVDFKFDKISAKIYRGKGATTLLIVFLIVLQLISIIGKITTDERPRDIAKYLKEHMDDDDFVYMSNSHHIVYYLLRQECPTPYVHSSILSRSDHCYAFNVDPEQEVKRIIDEKPAYIVIKQPFEIVKNAIADEYELETTFEDDLMQVYRRKD